MLMCFTLSQLCVVQGEQLKGKGKQPRKKTKKRAKTPKVHVLFICWHACINNYYSIQSYSDELDPSDSYKKV